MAGTWQTVPNTFTSNTKAKSAEVNANFSAILLNDGTKDINIGMGFMKTSAKSADYTITDTDGITTVLMTTGGTNRSVTLPTLADNQGRIIHIKKVDSGTGKLTIDGEGSETIDGSTTKDIFTQYGSITLHAGASEWQIINRVLPYSMLRVVDGNGYGSTNTRIRRFGAAALETVGADITYADSAADGGSFTVNVPGVYAISYSDSDSGSGATGIGVSRNSNQLTTNIVSITDAHILLYGKDTASTGPTFVVSGTFYLAAGDIIRAHTDGQLNGNAEVGTRFTITRCS